MNIVDKIIQEWSWRCEKGYPDINNPKDLQKLQELVPEELYEHLLESINIVETSKKDFTYLSPDVQDIALDVAKELNIQQNNIKASTKRSIIILTDIPRSEFFQKIESKGYSQKNRNSAVNTENNTVIIHKPLSAQIGGGHGKLNEKNLFNTINNYIAQESVLDVKFTGNNGVQLLVENITEAVDASKVGALEYVKSDIELLNGQEVVLGVSIKEDTGGRWESSKKRFPDLFKQFIKKGLQGKIDNLILEPVPEEVNKYRMKTPSGKNYGKVYVEGIPEKEKIFKEMVFGPANLTYPTIVVERSFSPSDFNLIEKNTGNSLLEVKCSYLFREYEDVVEAGKQPILVFSHHIGASTGIELRAFPKDKVPSEGKGVSLTVNYNDIIKEDE